MVTGPLETWSNVSRRLKEKWWNRGNVNINGKAEVAQRTRESTL